jgi:hypothetical protein
MKQDITRHLEQETTSKGMHTFNYMKTVRKKKHFKKRIKQIMPPPSPPPKHKRHPNYATRYRKIQFYFIENALRLRYKDRTVIAVYENKRCFLQHTIT